MFSGHLGASALANPKIPNFTRSVAAARRDLRRKPKSRAGAERSARHSPGSGGRRGHLTPAERARTFAHGEKKGHVGSWAKRKSIVRVDEHGRWMSPEEAAEHDGASVAAAVKGPRPSVQMQHPSVTQTMGIARIDPRTLKRIPEERLNTNVSAGGPSHIGGSGDSDRFVGPPPPRPPVDSPPAGLQFGSPSASTPEASQPPTAETTASVAAAAETQPPWTSDAASTLPPPPPPPPTPPTTLPPSKETVAPPTHSAYVAHHILEAIRYRRSLYGLQLTDARSVFEAMDRDGDGQLSRSEFEKALNRLGMGLRKNQIQALVAAMGRTDSGGIPFEAFLQMMDTGEVRDGAASKMKPRSESKEAQPRTGLGRGVSRNRRSSAPGRSQGIPASNGHESNTTTATFSDDKFKRRARKHNHTVSISGDPRVAAVINDAPRYQPPHKKHDFGDEQAHAALEERGAAHGNSGWILRRNSLATTIRTGTAEFLEKRAQPKAKPRIKVNDIPSFKGKKSVVKKKTPTGSEFERVNSAFYRRKVDTAKRAKEIKQHISPTIPRQVLAKQRATARASAAKKRMSSESRAQSMPLHSSESHRSKRRRNSFVSKSDAIRHERRQKAMQKFKSKKTKTTRKMQKSPSSYKKYSIANKSPPRSSGSKFMSKARFAEDLSDRSHVPGSARLAFMDGAYKDSCEIFAQVLLQTGTRREYYNDIIESIRQYFVAEDIRKTGLIGVADLRQSILSIDIGINAAGADAICGAARTDRDGFLYYPEYLAALRATLKDQNMAAVDSSGLQSADEKNAGVDEKTPTGDEPLILTKEQILERQKIMAELQRLGIEFDASDFGAVSQAHTVRKEMTGQSKAASKIIKKIFKAKVGFNSQHGKNSSVVKEI
eukprot:g2706.t1